MITKLGLVVALLVVAACEDDTPDLGTAYARVVEDRVEFELYADTGAIVTIGDLPPFEYPLRPLPTLPLAGFPDGENVVEVRFQKGSTSHVDKARFTKQPGSATPFVRLTGCALAGASGGYVGLTSSLGAVAHCQVADDGSVTLQLAASQGGSLTIDGHQIAVGGDGKASHVASLDAAFLAAPVAAAVGKGSDAAGPSLKVVLTRDGATVVDAAIEVTLDDVPERARAIFTAIGKGELPARGDGAPAVERRSLVYVPPTAWQKLLHLGRTSTIGGVGKIAIATDLPARYGGDCGPYASVGGPGMVDSTPARKLIDVEVTVHDAVTGEQLAQKRFTTGHDGCPTTVITSGGASEDVESRPDDKAITRWLSGLIRK